MKDETSGMGWMAAKPAHLPNAGGGCTDGPGAQDAHRFAAELAAYEAAQCEVALPAPPSAPRSANDRTAASSNSCLFAAGGLARTGS